MVQKFSNLSNPCWPEFISEKQKILVIGSGGGSDARQDVADPPRWQGAIQGGAEPV